jgi:hypothetical protein
MIAAVIFVASTAAFLEFFVLCCHSILTVTGETQLSERVRVVAGTETIPPQDFERLLQLVRLFPERRKDQREIRAVVTYYQSLCALGRAARFTFPGIVKRVDQELVLLFCRRCARSEQNPQSRTSRVRDRRKPATLVGCQSRTALAPLDPLRSGLLPWPCLHREYGRRPRHENTTRTACP